MQLLKCTLKKMIPADVSVGCVATKGIRIVLSHAGTCVVSRQCCSPRLQQQAMNKYASQHSLRALLVLCMHTNIFLDVYTLVNQ